jgi:hypothetical protein
VYVRVTVVATVVGVERVAVKVATPAAFSAIEVVPVKVTVGIVSSSVIVTVAVCVPDSVAPLPPATAVILAITVSEPSNVTSLVGSIVTVPVVEPAGMIIVVELAA